MGVDEEELEFTQASQSTVLQRIGLAILLGFAVTVLFVAVLL